MKLIHGIAVDGRQVEPLHGMPTDNFCIGGRFHIGVSLNIVPRTGWHISVAPWCPCFGPMVRVEQEVFMESVTKVMAQIGKRLYMHGPSDVGVYHWDEIRRS